MLRPDTEPGSGHLKAGAGACGPAQTSISDPSPGADKQGSALSAVPGLRSTEKDHGPYQPGERQRPLHCSPVGPFSVMEDHLLAAGRGYGVSVLCPGLEPACKAWAGRGGLTARTPAAKPRKQRTLGLGSREASCPCGVELESPSSLGPVAQLREAPEPTGPHLSFRERFSILGLLGTCPWASLRLSTICASPSSFVSRSR